MGNSYIKYEKAGTYFERFAFLRAKTFKPIARQLFHISAEFLSELVRASARLTGNLQL